MTSIANALKTLNHQDRQLNNVFLQGILEGFTDGILILTEQGEVLHANRQLHQIIEHLTPSDFELCRLNQEIWRIHQATIDLSDLCSDRPVIIESDIPTITLGTLQLQARQFQMVTFPSALVLVTIQDQRLQKRVPLSDVQQYGLTPREIEVWALRRANYSYAEIAAQLFISTNTVHKHVKNINIKLGATPQSRLKAS